MPVKLGFGRNPARLYLPARVGTGCFRRARTGYQLTVPNRRLEQGAAMYMDDDEVERAVAADLEECWQGEGWYRVCFTDGMGSYPATWYETEADLADDLRDRPGGREDMAGRGMVSGDGRLRREVGAGLLRYARLPCPGLARCLRRGILQRRRMRPARRAGPGPHPSHSRPLIRPVFRTGRPTWKSYCVSHTRLPTGRMGSLRPSGHGKRRAAAPIHTYPHRRTSMRLRICASGYIQADGAGRRNRNGDAGGGIGLPPEPKG